MNTKRFIAIVLTLTLALTLAFSLAACGGGNDASSTASPASTGASQAIQGSGATASGLPEGLADLTIMINGEAVILPKPLEDFLALGWGSFYGPDVPNLDGKLEAKQYYDFVAQNGTSKVVLSTANLQDGQPSALRQGTVFMVDAELSNIRFSSNDVDFELPLGIKLGVSTKDDVIAAYGEPDYLSTDEGYINYQKDDYNLGIEYNLDSGVIKRISIGQGPSALGVTDVWTIE